MNLRPFRFMTDLHVKLPCIDRSDDNIIYFDNYVLYRPNYRRPKTNNGYDYQNAVLIDLDNSHIDINKFYDLLKAHDIDIKKQKHIGFTDATIWIEQLEQSCVTKYLEIPNTDLYHLHRIQYCKNSNKLLITHLNYDDLDEESYRLHWACNPVQRYWRNTDLSPTKDGLKIPWSRNFNYTPHHTDNPVQCERYTLIDTKNMVILRSNFMNFYEPNLNVYKILSKMKITYDCEFSYLEMDEENTITKYNYREDTINLKNILAQKKELINTLPETEYTFYGTGIVKHNGLLFINKNAWNTQWYYEQSMLKQLPDVITSELPLELQNIIKQYQMHDVYTYIKNIYALMQVIGIIRISCLLYNEHVFDKLNIPATFAEFCKLVK